MQGTIDKKIKKKTQKQTKTKNRKHKTEHQGLFHSLQQTKASPENKQSPQHSILKLGWSRGEMSLATTISVKQDKCSVCYSLRFLI